MMELTKLGNEELLNKYLAELAGDFTDTDDRDAYRAELLRRLSGQTVPEGAECGHFTGRTPEGIESHCKKPKGHDGSCNPLHGLSFTLSGSGAAVSASPQMYTPSGPRGGGPCLHCERARRQHEGKHEFCPVIVIYERPAAPQKGKP